MLVGKRVGAIQKSDAETVYFFGYGIYDGDHIPDDGWMKDAMIPNPKIKLDNGSTVYGYECWWGSEEKVKKLIGDRKVIFVHKENQHD